MKSKSFSLLSLSILMLVMFMSLGSALTLSAPSSITLKPTDVSKTLTVTGDENFTITSYNNSLTIIDSDDHELQLAITNISDSVNVSSVEFNITATVPSEFNLGSYSATFTVEAENASNSSNTDSETVTIYFENTEFCTIDEDGSLEVNIDDIEVVSGFGDDDEYWYPLDEIEVKIEVENTNNDEKIKDIEVAWILVGPDGQEVMSDEEKDFDLKRDDTEIITINFKLDKHIDELEDGEYVLFVKATGEEEDVDVCVSESKPIDIIIESDFVVLDDFQFPETVSCGSEIQITADVWNIGDDEQDDVYVLVYNQELELFEEEIEIGDIDDFDDKELVFEFQIPEDAKEKWYTLEFTVYDDSNDVYENDNDDKAEFTISFKVEGSCAVEPQVVVSASLESGGKAGEELVVKATVTNTGSKLMTYELNPVDYTDWATLISVEPSTIILSAGESKDVLITFDVNKDVSEDKLFNIELLLEDEQVIKQPVSVTIEKSGSGLGFITGNIISESNWYLWGIGALNVILIIVIILVALRVAKK